MLALSVKTCLIIFVVIVGTSVIVVTPIAIKLIVESDKYMAEIADAAAATNLTGSVNSTETVESYGSGAGSRNVETFGFQTVEFAELNGTPKDDRTDKKTDSKMDDKNTDPRKKSNDESEIRIQLTNYHVPPRTFNRVEVPFDPIIVFE